MLKFLQRKEYIDFACDVFLDRNGITSELFTFLFTYSSLMISVTAIFRIRLAGA